jgi:hypothetical protein
MADIIMIEMRNPPALHPPGRQMEGEIDHAGKTQPVERLGKRVANALQSRDFGKQRIEKFGSHG